MENINFNSEKIFGYNFYIADFLDFAFDEKRKMLLIIDPKNDYLNGSVYFYELENNKTKIKFKPRGDFIFEIIDKNVYIYNFYPVLP